MTLPFPLPSDLSLLTLGRFLRDQLLSSSLPVAAVATLLANPAVALQRGELAVSPDLLPFPPSMAFHCLSSPPLSEDAQHWLFCLVVVVNFLHGGADPSRTDLVFSSFPLSKLQQAAFPSFSGLSKSG